VPDRGIVFDFMLDSWFASPRASFRRVALIAAFLALGVAAAMLPFAFEIVHSLRR
jgi:hypothetical protein